MANNPYAKLFDPMQIGEMKLKNRLIMAPMGTFTVITSYSIHYTKLYDDGQH